MVVMMECAKSTWSNAEGQCGRTVECGRLNANSRIRRSNADGQCGGWNADSRKRRLRTFEIGCG